MSRRGKVLFRLVPALLVFLVLVVGAVWVVRSITITDGFVRDGLWFLAVVLIVVVAAIGVYRMIEEVREYRRELQEWYAAQDRGDW